MMNEQELAKQLLELVEQAEGKSVVQTKLNALARQAQANRKKIEVSLQNLQESIDYLRVCLKYQVFDLEATRRENAYLRKLLEEQ